LADWCKGIVKYVLVTEHGPELVDEMPTDTEPDKFYAYLVVPTMKGEMVGKVNDWLACGIESEFYPIRDSVYRASYEDVVQIG